MSAKDGAVSDRASRRLDQWLWFARFVKSRSLAARLCAGGAVLVNGIAVTKPNYALRAGDVVSVPQGGWRRTARVVALGTRRGPASEARLLFEEELVEKRHKDLPAAWQPLLMGEGLEDRYSLE